MTPDRALRLAAARRRCGATARADPRALHGEPVARAPRHRTRRRTAARDSRAPAARHRRPLSRRDRHPCGRPGLARRGGRRAAGGAWRTDARCGSCARPARLSSEPGLAPDRPGARAGRLRPFQPAAGGTASGFRPPSRSQTSCAAGTARGAVCAAAESGRLPPSSSRPRGRRGRSAHGIAWIGAWPLRSARAGPSSCSSRPRSRPARSSACASRSLRRRAAAGAARRSSGRHAAAARRPPGREPSPAPGARSTPRWRRSSRSRGWPSSVERRATRPPVDGRAGGRRCGLSRQAAAQRRRRSVSSACRRGMPPAGAVGRPEAAIGRRIAVALPGRRAAHGGRARDRRCGSTPRATWRSGSTTPPACRRVTWRVRTPTCSWSAGPRLRTRRRPRETCSSSAAGTDRRSAVATLRLPAAAVREHHRRRGSRLAAPRRPSVARRRVSVPAVRCVVVAPTTRHSIAACWRGGRGVGRHRGRRGGALGVGCSAAPSRPAMFCLSPTRPAHRRPSWARGRGARVPGPRDRPPRRSDADIDTYRAALRAGACAVAALPVSPAGLAPPWPMRCGAQRPAGAATGAAGRGRRGRRAPAEASGPVPWPWARRRTARASRRPRRKRAGLAFALGAAPDRSLADLAQAGEALASGIGTVAVEHPCWPAVCRQGRPMPDPLGVRARVGL